MGSAVVVPLSDYSELGVVVGLVDADSGCATKDVRALVERLSLSPDLIGLCQWASEAAAIPLPVVLRAALPPGLSASRYRIVEPAPGWRWSAGDLIERATLRRVLGGEGLRNAERDGRVELSPRSEQGKVEWAVVEKDVTSDSSWTARQRELYQFLSERESGYRTAALFSESGIRRDVLRRLVRRGGARLEERPETSAIFTTSDASMEHRAPFARDTNRVVDRGGAWLWRVPAKDWMRAVSSLARTVLEDGDQTLILAPDAKLVERLAQSLRSLPGRSRVASYHSGLGKSRGAVYEAAREGAVDVLVGTRAAALIPFERLGAICVVDEPSEAHRAEPGYEGVPIHVRELALERSRVAGAAVLFLSNTPSLQLYARREVRELPARPARDRPAIRIVDMRGSGAALSSTLLGECRRTTGEGGRVGVIANRLGYAAVISCGRCGTVRSCPGCDLPLTYHRSMGAFVCSRCGKRYPAEACCGFCGSERLISTGLGVERVRDEISAALNVPVGLLTAGDRELADAAVVAGTAKLILDQEWDAVVIPAADGHLLAGGINAVERAFRVFYRAVEAARKLVLIQTRSPEHYALQAALRGDYPSFAKAELSRRCELKYPPYGHLATLTLAGTEEEVRRAVESELRPDIAPEVEMSEPVPVIRPGGSAAWRVLLRSGDRSSVARAGMAAARKLARIRGSGGIKAQVDIDPEEV